MMRGYRPAHYDFVFDYRTLDFGRGNVSSYATFGRTFDLFGDGSVRLAFTPGHSAGHMCVICPPARPRLRDRRRRRLHHGQLEGDARTPAPPRRPHNWRRSLQELKLFRSQYPEAVIAPGHDPEF